MTQTGRFRLTDIPVHLGPGGTATPQPPFSGAPDWYQSYGERTEADGREGRLVMMNTFTEPWASWEVHPHGEELVVSTEGSITLHQEIDGTVRTVTITNGEAIVNPPGVWHTADVLGTATTLFVTVGMGTEPRPR
jgi:mannose-6-phosphate isomerase-like protein (cupin superfamily)